MSTGVWVLSWLSSTAWVGARGATRHLPGRDWSCTLKFWFVSSKSSRTQRGPGHWEPAREWRWGWRSPAAGSLLICRYLQNRIPRCCWSFLPAALSSGFLRIDSSVGDSNMYPNTEAGLSDLLLFRFLKRQTPSLLLSSLLKKIPPFSRNFLKESPAALGLLQTTSRSPM